MTAGPVCAACWNRIALITPPVCDACGEPLASGRTIGGRALCPRCAGGGRPVDRARAVGAYEGTLRDLIHAMKYDGRRSLARPLGGLLARQGADLLEGADLCVPVPLHWTRQWRRGFNQAAELAARLPLPVVKALSRVRRTGVQAELDASRREANVAGAFALSRRRLDRLRVARAPGAGIAGATIVLVDDVCTTGATLDACAGVLKRAGAREVRALVVALTLRRRAGSADVLAKLQRLRHRRGDVRRDAVDVAGGIDDHPAGAGG